MPAPKGPRGPQVREATLFVSRTFPNGDTTEDNGPIEVKQFQGEVAHVQAKLARTVNLGDYNSIRLEIGVSYPCYPEEVNEGLEFVTGLVGQFLFNEVEELKKMKGDI